MQVCVSAGCSLLFVTVAAALVSSYIFVPWPHFQVYVIESSVRRVWIGRVLMSYELEVSVYVVCQYIAVSFECCIW